MANKVRPIKPEEVVKAKKTNFPDAVFEAFNEMITENYAGRVATFKQDDVVKLMVQKGLGRNDIFKKGWLDIEDVYDKAGWEVDYDRPGWNETYDTTFTFRDRRVHR